MRWFGVCVAKAGAGDRRSHVSVGSPILIEASFGEKIQNFKFPRKGSYDDTSQINASIIFNPEEKRISVKIPSLAQHDSVFRYKISKKKEKTASVRMTIAPRPSCWGQSTYYYNMIIVDYFWSWRVVQLPRQFSRAYLCSYGPQFSSSADACVPALTQPSSFWVDLFCSFSTYLHRT